MSEKEKETQTAEEERIEKETSSEQVEKGSTDCAPSSESEVKETTLEDKFEALEKEHANLKDQYLRKCADFENYRKRMQREKQETYDYANTNLLTDLIAIMDDFDRALDAGKDSDGKALEDLAPVVDGIKMINKQMRGLFEAKYNLECYAEKGDFFDHDIHEAIGKCEGAVADPVCSEVYLKGYRLKDRVIRPAKVMVTMPDGSVESTESEGCEDKNASEDAE